MRLLLTFLAINLLPIFLTTQAARLKSKPRLGTQPVAFDRTRSFHCGKKLFLSEIIISTIDYVTGPERPVQLKPYDADLQFPHAGPLGTWPLPTQNLAKPWKTGYQPVFFMVFGGHDRSFLGVIYFVKVNEEGRNVYSHCQEAHAGGIIRSVTPPNGGFRCLDHIITTKDAIGYVEKERKRLQRSVNPFMKFPLIYKGSLRFIGQGPHTVWPISAYKRSFESTATQFLVLDINLNVVGALFTIKDQYEQCPQVTEPKIQISILIPPIVVQPDEIDMFECFGRYISAHQVKEGTKDAILGFVKRKTDKRYMYPKPYHQSNSNSGTSELFIWPVRTQRRPGRAHTPTVGEPFMAIIDRLGNIHDVVVENVAGQIEKCKRVSVHQRDYHHHNLS